MQTRIVSMRRAFGLTERDTPLQAALNHGTSPSSPRRPQADWLLSRRDLMAIYAISSTTLWRRVRDRTWPQPIVLTPRTVRWRASDVFAHVASLSQKANAAPPDRPRVRLEETRP
jgi:predicted DNA-binding transcriptional regulator AlpA